MKTIEDIQADLAEGIVIAPKAEPGQLVGRFELIGKLLEILGGWRGLLAGLDKEEVKKVVIDFYVGYIKPIDIPGVPFFLEGLVDDAIQRLLEKVIDRLFEEVDDAP